MVDAICGRCGRKFDFPSKLLSINCACGARVFRCKKEKVPRTPPKEEKNVIKAKKKSSIVKKIKDKIKKKSTSEKIKESKENIEDIDKQIKDKKKQLKDLNKPPKPITEEKKAEKEKEADIEDIKEEKVPAPPKEENILLQKLIRIPGIAKKAAEEICEEYNSIDKIKAAIKNKTFSVGGVGIFKKQLILKFLK